MLAYQLTLGEVIIVILFWGTESNADDPLTQLWATLIASAVRFVLALFSVRAFDRAKLPEEPVREDERTIGPLWTRTWVGIVLEKALTRVPFVGERLYGFMIWCSERSDGQPGWLLALRQTVPRPTRAGRGSKPHKRSVRSSLTGQSQGGHILSAEAAHAREREGMRVSPQCGWWDSPSASVLLTDPAAAQFCSDLLRDVPNRFRLAASGQATFKLVGYGKPGWLHRGRKLCTIVWKQAADSPPLGPLADARRDEGPFQAAGFECVRCSGPVGVHIDPKSLHALQRLSRRDSETGAPLGLMALSHSSGGEPSLVLGQTAPDESGGIVGVRVGEGPPVSFHRVELYIYRPSAAVACPDSDDNHDDGSEKRAPPSPSPSPPPSPPAAVPSLPAPNWPSVPSANSAGARALQRARAARVSCTQSGAESATDWQPPPVAPEVVTPALPEAGHLAVPERPERFESAPAAVPKPPGRIAHVAAVDMSQTRRAVRIAEFEEGGGRRTSVRSGGGRRTSNQSGGRRTSTSTGRRTSLNSAKSIVLKKVGSNVKAVAQYAVEVAEEKAATLSDAMGTASENVTAARERWKRGDLVDLQGVPLSAVVWQSNATAGFFFEDPREQFVKDPREAALAFKRLSVVAPAEIVTEQLSDDHRRSMTAHLQRAQRATSARGSLMAADSLFEMMGQHLSDAPRPPSPPPHPSPPASPPVASARCMTSSTHSPAQGGLVVPPRYVVIERLRRERRCCGLLRTGTVTLTYSRAAAADVEVRLGQLMHPSDAHLRLAQWYEALLGGDERMMRHREAIHHMEDAASLEPAWRDALTPFCRGFEPHKLALGWHLNYLLLVALLALLVMDFITLHDSLPFGEIGL